MTLSIKTVQNVRFKSKSGIMEDWNDGIVEKGTALLRLFALFQRSIIPTFITNLKPETYPTYPSSLHPRPSPLLGVPD
jgi:hypothetical protein